MNLDLMNLKNKESPIKNSNANYHTNLNELQSQRSQEDQTAFYELCSKSNHPNVLICPKDGYEDGPFVQHSETAKNVQKMG